MFIYIFTICFHLNYVGRKFLYYNIRYYKVDVSIGLIHCSETESRLYKRIVVNNYYWGNTVTILKNLNMKRWLYVLYIKRSAFGAMRTLDIGDKGFPPPSDKERKQKSMKTHTHKEISLLSLKNQMRMTLKESRQK